MQATATCIFNKTSISLTNPEIFSVKYNLESPKSRFSQQVKKFSALPILRFRKSAFNGEITAVDRRSKGENLSSPLDEKPYELLPGGRRAYLDEQDIVTLLDPPKELIPLDPASYNPAAYLWKKIGDIPEERRHRLLYLLKPRLVSRIWEIAGTRYEDSKLVKKSASSLLSTGDSLLSPEIWSCRTSGGPVPVAWIRDFKKVNSQISRVSYGLFGILKVKQAVTNNISFELGSGVPIRFWEDLWVGETKLKDQFPNIFRLAPIKNIFISDCYAFTAAKIVWDVRSVRNCRDSEIAEYVELLECISKTMPQISEPDKLIWRIDKSSRFTAIFCGKDGKTYGRIFLGGSLLPRISNSICPLYFTVVKLTEVMSTEQPCDLAYEFGDGLLDLHEYPEGFPKPAKHPWPFDDYVVVYIRHVGPGVMVGQAWQEGKALVQVPRKFCGEILMVKDYTV